MKRIWIPVGLGAMVMGFAGGFYFGHKTLTAEFVEYYTPPPPTPGGPSLKEARAYSLPLNNPDTVSAKDATHMRDDDPVYGVVYNGRARAYPRWLMIAYHIANDTIDGEPLLLTQCEVCSSASAWVPISDWPPNTAMFFYPCGFHGGTFDMCDNYTNTIWHPFSGIAFHGFMNGHRLARRVPVVVQRWKQWREAHPDTDVVFSSPNVRERKHSHGPEYDIGKPFNLNYMTRTANLSDKRLPPETLVYGIKDPHSQKAKAFPLDKSKTGAGEVEVASQRYFVVHADEFAAAAFAIPSDSRGLRVIEWKPLVLGDERQGRWNIFGQPLADSKVNAPLPAADGYMGEWYEWISEHPQSMIGSAF